LTRPVTANGHKGGSTEPQREVRGGPDGRAPPVSSRKKNKRGKEGAGSADRLGGPRGRALGRRCAGEGR
jgi:hypothetical protein